MGETCGRFGAGDEGFATGFAGALVFIGFAGGEIGGLGAAPAMAGLAVGVEAACSIGLAS